MGTERYEVDGTDDGGWGVFDPDGVLVGLHVNKADADASAAAENARLAPGADMDSPDRES